MDACFFVRGCLIFTKLISTRARYGDTVLEIDQVREAGTETIGIITEQRQSH
jgi:hypothetical protein